MRKNKTEQKDQNYEKYLHDNQGNISLVTFDSFSNMTVNLKNGESKTFDLSDFFYYFEDQTVQTVLEDLRYYHVPSIKKI